MGRPLVHFEIACRDSQKTRGFYSNMFGREVSPMSGHGGSGSPWDWGPGSALGHEPLHCTIFYVAVEDVAATLKKESLAGKTLVPPVNTGTFAWMQDPEGNTGKRKRKSPRSGWCVRI